MSDIHDFDNTVVAVLAPTPRGRDAIEALSDAGYEFEVLQGEDGKSHLEGSDEEGLAASLKRMATALGDENRVLSRLGDELTRGRVVVSVDVADSEPTDAVAILRDHGADYVWKFGSWSFTPIEK